MRVAVIGMAARLPGGIETPEDYWRVLQLDHSVIGPPPTSRWDLTRYYEPALAQLGDGLHRAGFLRRIDLFDAEFFKMAESEAAALDPQQRLLLEVAWEALCRSGIEPSSLKGSETGVYAAVGNSDYDRLSCRDVSRITSHTGVGTQYCSVPARVSYALDLRGPSIAVDTGCSSALVGLQIACHSLERGEIDAALVCATNVIISPEKTITLARAGMLSASARCRAFDAAADGYVRAEGCAVVVLKRAADVDPARDPVLGYIRGGAVNHGGTSNGFSAPRGPRQQDVIRSALRNAGIAASDVTYLESHGTGTLLGDLIEMRAASAVYGRPKDGSACAVGAVKANLGHSEPVSGLASLIKVLLCGNHATIPGAVEFSEPSPRLGLEQTPFFIPRRAVEWPGEDTRRFAAVSCFSFCGTNAHVIVEGVRASEMLARSGLPIPSFARKSHWFEAH